MEREAQVIREMRDAMDRMTHEPEHAVLTDEEQQMLLAFRRFKLSNGTCTSGVFAFPTNLDTLTVGSCNAYDWACAFLKHVRDNPAALSERTMTAWFSEAIMRGYDEHGQQHKAEGRAAGRRSCPQCGNNQK